MTDPTVHPDPTPQGWDPQGQAPPPLPPTPAAPGLPPVGARLNPLAGAQPYPEAQAAQPAQEAVRRPVEPQGFDQSAEQVLRDQFASGTGSVSRSFTSRRIADHVTLRVDGVPYRCAPSAPTDPLVAAVEAQESRDQYRLILALRHLIAAVMLPDDRARYEARCRAAVTEVLAPDPSIGAEDGWLVLVEPGTPGAEVRNLAPIDPVDMIAHGLWLVEVYFRRPTAPSAPSGAGR